MDRHFACTACGQCCYGWLPLTFADAFAHADKFPLSMVWTPIGQGSKAFDLTEKLGLKIRLADRKFAAIRIVPTVYIPPSFACPALDPKGLCSLQQQKPLRCRTMPFYPYAPRQHQSEHLKVRPGWKCDTSHTAPVIYENKTILDPTDFNAERAELMSQAPIAREYGQKLLSATPALLDLLTRAIRTPSGGHVALSFASLLRFWPPSQPCPADKTIIAHQQRAVLVEFMERTKESASLKEYYKNYDQWNWEMDRFHR